MRTRIVVAAMAMMVFALPAYSDVILSWDGNGPDGDGAANSDNFDAIVGVVGATGQAVSVSTGSINNDNLGPTPRLMGAYSPLTTVTSATEYVAFEAQAEAGYALDIDNFVWQMSSRGPGGNGSQGATDYCLRYVVGGGSEVVVASGSVYAASSNGLDDAGGQYTGAVGLSGVTDPVEFRLYLWGGILADGDASWRTLTYFDNVQIDGAVTPEPATMGLLAIGGVALLRRKS
jgi:PEP-CTERM motif-containing protein